MGTQALLLSDLTIKGRETLCENPWARQMRLITIFASISTPPYAHNACQCLFKIVITHPKRVMEIQVYI